MISAGKTLVLRFLLIVNLFKKIVLLFQGQSQELEFIRIFVLPYTNKKKSYKINAHFLTVHAPHFSNFL